jgi:hypothetical protein
LQPLIERALTGADPAPAPSLAAGLAMPVDEVWTVDGALWERVVTVPLYQQAALLVSTAQLQGVTPGTPLVGPFDGAEHWQLHR